jgi:hypothetical protein
MRFWTARDNKIKLGQFKHIALFHNMKISEFKNKVPKLRF